jgi:hypothetical protein
MSILPERSAGLKQGLAYRARLLTRRSRARRVGRCSYRGTLHLSGPRRCGIHRWRSEDRRHERPAGAPRVSACSKVLCMVKYLSGGHSMPASNDLATAESASWAATSSPLPSWRIAFLGAIPPRSATKNRAVFKVRSSNFSWAKAPAAGACCNAAGNSQTPPATRIFLKRSRYS